MPVFETPGNVSLQIRLPAGRVMVTTADKPRTEVELVPIGRRGREAIEEMIVTADERAGRHLITIEREDRFRWGPIQVSWGGDVEVRITCPEGTDLELSAGSTDLGAEGRLGEVSARTASGDVALETVSGKLEVKTASGDISVRTIESNASLVTVSGDLEVGRIHAPITARSVSGDVNLKAVEAGEVRVQTVSGDTRIGVGRGTRVWIDAASVSGDLGSELGLADQAPGGEHDEEGAVVPLHVKTVSGDVSIVRAAETFSA